MAQGLVLCVLLSCLSSCFHIQETLKHRMSPMLGSADELQLLANICKLIRAKKTLDIGVHSYFFTVRLFAKHLP